MREGGLVARKYRNMRASEVLKLNRERFLKRFLILKNNALATDIRVFGSIARQTDTEDSDIDLLIGVYDASPRNYCLITDYMSEWIKFPVHITLNDGKIFIPLHILSEAIPL